jgi:hypothetical protein
MDGRDTTRRVGEEEKILLAREGISKRVGRETTCWRTHGERKKLVGAWREGIIGCMIRR